MDLVALWMWLTIVAVAIESQVGEGQQTYVNNKQLDCYNEAFNSTTQGFECNGVESSCKSYLTFRSTPPYYTTPVTISYLLGAPDSASLIASLNNITSDMESIPPNTQVIVPVNCSCHGRRYYQHNATYTLKLPSETYFSVANNTYQGLSTCQAMMSQNPYGDRNLSVGMSLEVPLRCACPTSNQTTSALGIKYLLTYMVTWGDSFSSIAQLFGVDQQRILDANQLSSTSIIFPFTPLLIPLTTEPTTIGEPPSPPPSPQIPVVPVGDSNPSSSNNKKWVYVGVGIGAAALLLIFLGFGFLFWYRNPKPIPTSPPQPKKALQPEESSALPLPDGNKSWSLSSDGVRYAIESLTLYKFHDLQVGTNYFSEDNRIKGSVYKGSFKGDAAAVKVIKGDVSSEINILKKINHSNIIRLSGFCLHDGSTYLVYEFAEHASLSDKNIQTLTWKERVQIAHDVADALNYLHNYTNPPYVHKNLKATNILLDANLRAKLANFGLARTLENEDAQGGLHLTRHVVGTQGYMAPEYVENGIVTPKLDVFAFGVVILELLSGKEATDKNARDETLPASICRVLEGHNVREKLCGFMDPSLGKDYPLDLAFSLAQLAQTCVSHDINARPPVSHVFISLSKLLSSSLDWDPSLETQGSRSIRSGR